MANKKLGILFLFAVVLSFAAGYLSSQIIPGVTFRGQDTYTQIIEDFRSSYYYEITSDDENEAYIASIRATISTFATLYDDPYTRLDETALTLNPTGSEGFVGLGIYYLFEGMNVRVLDVFYGSTVYGHIYPNDLIIGIDLKTSDILFETLTMESQVLELLRGQLDEEKSLIIKNPDDQILRVDITYQLIATPSVSIKNIHPDVGYIKITSFNQAINGQTVGTATQFGDLLAFLEEELLNDDPESKTLIIDLRDNPGGSLDALHNQQKQGVPPGILQQLVPRDVTQPLFEMVPRTGRTQVFLGGLSQAQRKAYDIKVLVNRNSASASEVMAAALKTTLGAEIYGSQTFGKKFYQDVVYLFDINQVRYNLVYTTGIWTYDNGKNIIDDPLMITPLATHSILMNEKPVYMGEVSFDQVNPSLILYQHFLNAYFGLEGNMRLRTDGYFDQSTENMIAAWQTQRGLLVTRKLDYQTANQIFTHYMTLKHDITYDIELSTLIDVITNG